MPRITAVFENAQQAQQAISAIRELGISDQHLFFSHKDGQQALPMRPDPDGTVNTEATPERSIDPITPNDGVPPVVIPPVANMGVPVGMAGMASPAGAVVLAAAFLNDRLGDHVNPMVAGQGDPERASHFYRDAFDHGHYLLSVDTEDSVQEEQVRDALARQHGRFFNA